MIFFSLRDKSILIGLYLSKYNDEALRRLGFESFIEAFNVLGYSVGAKPASLKNYRDEFDPLFPNPRKGWHNRPIRDYCKKFHTEFSNLDFDSFTELVKGFVIRDYGIEKLVAKIEKNKQTESVAKRLMTGKAAEEYFKVKYKVIPEFANFVIQDTTYLGCGFDFKLSQEENFYCVEVKGLNEKRGSISLTEKEFLTAKELTSQFCLFVVANFVEKPIHDFFFDPLNSRLKFKRTERQVIQLNYITSL